MNFTPFTGVGVPLSAAMPVATQFAGGKLTQSVATANGQVVGVLQGGENGVHYIRPLDPSAFAGSSSSHANGQQTQIITLPITMPGAKPGDPQQTVQIQVVNPIQAAVSMAQTTHTPTQKYQISQIPIQSFGQGATVLTVSYNPNQEGIQIVDGQNGIPEGMQVVAALQPQDIQLIQQHTNENEDKGDKEVMGTPITLVKHENPVVQEYIQRMHNSALPLSLQQFLKFNSDNSFIKQEMITEDGVVETVVETQDQSGENGLMITHYDAQMENEESIDDSDKGKKKKKYKKKPPKPKKPKPGQVHIATALDGTVLFCCPECHMAYPEKELLEQHLVGHKIERRFICDICGAGLKRKEHLERHKLGHNPERPFVCTVCMKGFKRKEHLNLHFVIHSGEKTEICGECGKGFYRKDHLRKHTRSHITKRAKELQQQTQTLINKDATTQVTIQVPTSQLQIPVQIQVPQHQIQLNSVNDDDSNPVSTVVLPQDTPNMTILPQDGIIIETNQDALRH